MPKKIPYRAKDGSTEYFENWTEEWNEACLREEEKKRNDPKQKERDAERKRQWEEAAKVKLREKLRTDPKFAEEWYKTHPDDRFE